MIYWRKYTILPTLVVITCILSIFLIQPAAANSIQITPGQGSSSPEIDFQFTLPVVFRPPDPPPVQPIEGTNISLFCSNTVQPIPDNNPVGLTTRFRIDDPRYIADLNIRLDIDHTWIGDLTISLRHEESGKSVELINRPGIPTGDTGEGCRRDNIKAILDDDITLPVDDECSSYPAAVGIYNYIEAAIAGSFIPEEKLDSYAGDAIAGHWTLTVSDASPHDTGRINQWCMAVQLTETPEIPVVDPPPNGLPRVASISGISGQRQALPLDCESRSAVDWARFFGQYIEELEFFYGLPGSDNPDQGFVGNVNGTWGQIPPNPYGVHAEPIAKRLRQFGLPADAQQFLSWNHLKAEIASGRPVIVWILGSGSSYPSYEYVVNGIPEYYRSSDGYISTVARFEHTVVVTGYDQDNVYYLNGGGITSKSTQQFLESWSALGNMAVVYRP